MGPYYLPHISIFVPRIASTFLSDYTKPLSISDLRVTPSTTAYPRVSQSRFLLMHEHTLKCFLGTLPLPGVSAHPYTYKSHHNHLDSQLRHPHTPSLILVHNSTPTGSLRTLTPPYYQVRKKLLLMPTNYLMNTIMYNKT